MQPMAVNEADRLAVLQALRILDTPPEEQFDALCRTARRLFDVPIAVVSLVDADRQWFKARCGLDVDETSREVAFCAHAILADGVLVVEDASRDPRFRDNPLVTGGLKIRFYAGAPLVIERDIRVGTLCIIDTVARAFTGEDRRALQDLAWVVTEQLRLHRARVESEDETALRRANEALIAAQKAELERCEGELRERQALLDSTLETMDQGLLMVDSKGVVQVHNRRFRELLGLPDSLLEGRPDFLTIHHHQVAAGEFARCENDFAEMAGQLQYVLTADRYERERPDGTVIEIRTVPFGDGGVVRTYTDVTVSRRGQAALRESERRYRILADALPHKVWITAPDGTALYYNAQMTVYHGPLGPALADRAALNHPDDVARIAAARKRAFDRGEPLEVEARLLRADGAWRWHRILMTPIRREGADEVVEWLGISLDIDDLYSDRQRL
jgi:PAS domain S-box-containing protein